LLLIEGFLVREREVKVEILLLQLDNLTYVLLRLFKSVELLCARVVL